MQTGERIAIKAAYIKKHGLPFETRGNTVSVMAIKATGVIAENMGDGRLLRVHWQRVSPITTKIPQLQWGCRPVDQLEIRSI